MADGRENPSQLLNAQRSVGHTWSYRVLPGLTDGQDFLTALRPAQVESRAGTGAPVTLSTTPPAGLEFFVRARVQ